MALPLANPTPRNHKTPLRIAGPSLSARRPTSDAITTIARFYNLHARHGVPKANLFGAAVVHGTGWRALLTDEAYQRRFGRINPSKAMVEELIANGARFAVCAHTAGSMGVEREELLPGLQLAISAMSALNVFYAEGYRLQPWR